MNKEYIAYIFTFTKTLFIILIVYLRSWEILHVKKVLQNLNLTSKDYLQNNCQGCA